MSYKDKEKQRATNYNWYLNNKESTDLRSKEAKESKRRFVDAVKSFPCQDCETSWPSCAMHFDHLNPEDKVDGVSRLVRSASWKRLVEEIMKCDLVCACCHALRTGGCH